MKLLKSFSVLTIILSAAIHTQESENNSIQADIEEIVVTATSRETSIFEVPYNISAISGDEVNSRGIQDAAELLRNFAGISSVDRGSRNAGTINNIRIRGLNVDSNALQDYPVSAAASVTTYVDNTPVFANFLLKDLERVEVLRGPQSTLYGSGSLGGTVRYITNKPDLTEFYGKVNFTSSEVDGSNSAGNNIDFVVNIPVLSNIAYRFVTTRSDYPGITDYVNVHQVEDYPGFQAFFGPIDGSTGIPSLKNGFITGFDFFTSPPVINPVKDADTVDIDFMRHKILIDLSDKIELLISSTSQEDAVGGRRASSTGTRYVLQDSCTNILLAGCYGASKYKDYENGAVMLEPSDREVTLNTAELTFDGSLADLEVSFSNYERRSESITDNTGFFANSGFLTAATSDYFYDWFGVGGIYSVPPRPYIPAERQYEQIGKTLEARLVSEKSDSFDYILGIFYQNETLERMQQTYIKGTNFWNGLYWAIDYVVDPLEKDFDYKVSETVKQKAVYGEFTFHTTDKIDITLGFRHFSLDADGESDMRFALYDLPSSMGLHENDEQDTLFKFNVSYMPSQNQTWYGTISEGFRRGGLNAVPTEGTFTEEEGWVPFNSDSVLNLEIGTKGVSSNGIFYNISLYQVNWNDPQLNTDTPNYSFYAVINGDEAKTMGLDVELSGTVGKLDWNLGYARNSSDLKEDLLTPASTPLVYAQSGDKLPGSPENMLNAGIAHTNYFSNGWGIVNRANLYFQSEMKNHLNNDSRYAQELNDFKIADMSSTIFKDDFYISLFIKNVSNERGVTAVFKSDAFGPNPSEGFYGSNDREFIALPRTIGISIEKSF